MTSGTRPPVRYIRWGEEGVRASDLGPSENQAILLLDQFQNGWLFLPLVGHKNIFVAS